MNFTKILLYLFFQTTLKASFEECLPISDWIKLNAENVEEDLDVRRLVSSTAEENTYGYKYLLGSGAYGKVYNVDFKTKAKNVSHSLAMKVIKLPEQKDSELERMTQIELNNLKELANIDRLHFIKFYGCIKTTGLPMRVIFFTDKLSQPLWTYETKTNALFLEFLLYRKVGLFIMMARSLKILADNGMAHMDVKPANFMLHNIGTTPIVKLIDYGFLNKHDTSFRGGTAIYVDPKAHFKGYKITSQSDLYSLGLTFAHLMTNDETMIFEPKCSDTYTYADMVMWSKVRYTSIKITLGEMARKKPNPDPTNQKQLRRLNDIILDVIDYSNPKITSFEKLITELEAVLDILYPNSIYHSDRVDQLLLDTYGVMSHPEPKAVWEKPMMARPGKPQISQQINKPSITNNKLASYYKLAHEAKATKIAGMGSNPNTFEIDMEGSIPATKRLSRNNRIDSSMAFKYLDKSLNSAMMGRSDYMISDSMHGPDVSGRYSNVSEFTHKTERANEVGDHTGFIGRMSNATYMPNFFPPSSSSSMNQSFIPRDNINSPIADTSMSQIPEENSSRNSINSNMQINGKLRFPTEMEIAQEYEAQITKHRLNDQVVNRLKAEMTKKIKEIKAAKAKEFSRMINEMNKKGVVKQGLNTTTQFQLAR